MTVFKFFGFTIGILAVLYVALLFTPKVAKLIDNFINNYRKKHPKDPEDERLYLVRSAFDGNRQIDMDTLYEQEKARRELNGSNEKNNNTLDDNGDVKDNG